MAKRKTAARKTAARKTGRKAKSTPKKALKAARSSKAAKKRPARKAAAKAGARKAGAKKATPRKVAKKAARKAAPRASARKAAKKTRVTRPVAPVLKRPAKAVAPIAGKAAKAAPKGARPKRATRPAPIRGAIPSSLGMNGGSSAARSGREDLLQHIKERTETSPAITAGDVDADWQLAYSSGDEAPGGDNPTPDQDVVDEIGEALGLEYDDEEELKGAAKIEDRDKHRWELNPDSKDEFDDE